MGIETLQSAAHAAGFAMVAAEEPACEVVETREEPRRVGAPALLLKDEGATAEAAHGVVEKAQASFGEWVKSMIGSSGRAHA